MFGRNNETKVVEVAATHNPNTIKWNPSIFYVCRVCGNDGAEMFCWIWKLQIGENVTIEIDGRKEIFIKRAKDSIEWVGWFQNIRPSTDFFFDVEYTIYASQYDVNHEFVLHVRGKKYKIIITTMWLLKKFVRMQMIHY